MTLPAVVFFNDLLQQTTILISFGARLRQPTDLSGQVSPDGRPDWHAGQMFPFPLRQNPTICRLVLTAVEVSQVRFHVSAILLANDGTPAPNDFSKTTNEHCEISDSFVENYVVFKLEAYSRLQQYMVASFMHQNQYSRVDAVEVFSRHCDGSIALFINEEMAGFRLQRRDPDGRYKPWDLKSRRPVSSVLINPIQCSRQVMRGRAKCHGRGCKKKTTLGIAAALAVSPSSEVLKDSRERQIDDVQRGVPSSELTPVRQYREFARLLSLSQRSIAAISKVSKSAGF